MPFVGGYDQRQSSTLKRRAALCASQPAQREKVARFVTIHGHELSPTNYAACQADFLAKNDLQGTVNYGNSLRRYCALD